MPKAHWVSELQICWFKVRSRCWPSTSQAVSLASASTPGVGEVDVARVQQHRLGVVAGRLLGCGVVNEASHHIPEQGAVPIPLLEVKCSGACKNVRCSDSKQIAWTLVGSGVLTPLRPSPQPYSLELENDSVTQPDMAAVKGPDPLPGCCGHLFRLVIQACASRGMISYSNSTATFPKFTICGQLQG